MTENLTQDFFEQTEAKPKVSILKWWLPFVIFAIIIFFDQALKFWIKKNMSIYTEKPIFGDWFILHFTENNGMAFGLELPFKHGKLFLTTSRIIVAIFGVWYLLKSIKENKHIGFLVCVALVLAGAIGNIIDSVFYGVWFKDINNYHPSTWFQGRVVDMLYVPIIKTHYPTWSPIKAGQEFVFFSPVFNLADAAVSTGIVSLLIFNKKFFPVTIENKYSDDIKETENSIIKENIDENQLNSKDEIKDSE